MNIGRITRQWLPLAAVASGLTLVLFVCVQQTLRQGADDPQIQLAEDAAHALAAGAAPEAVLPAGAPVDLGRSLAPWVAVYDGEGRPLAASGRLDGAAPALPAGLFGFARRHGEHRVTWMPRGGVRMATVLVSVSGGSRVVAAGRSLRDVETRESQMQFFCAAGLLATLAASLALALFLDWWLGKNP